MTTDHPTLRLVGSGPIVMVDDDEIDRTLTEKVHERSDVENEFIWFEDGPSFLAHLDRCIEHGVTLPAMVLLDINMPRMDGFEVIATMRSRPEFEKIPVTVFFSNSDNPADRERAESYGTVLHQKFVDVASGIEFFNSLLPRTS